MKYKISAAFFVLMLASMVVLVLPPYIAIADDIVLMLCTLGGTLFVTCAALGI